MNTYRSEKTKQLRKRCSNCRREIPIGNEYFLETKAFCEDCLIDVRTPHTRKTHWQYIGSIKADYLIPGKDG